MTKPFALVGCLLAISLLFAHAGAAKEPAPPEDPMVKKLEYTKQILAGLATEDFALITKNAEALNELGKRRWTEEQSPQYRMQHQVFWFTNEALLDAAKEKNVDGATLAYTQMTLSCVNCHKLIRNR